MRQNILWKIDHYRFKTKWVLFIFVNIKDVLLFIFQLPRIWTLKKEKQPKPKPNPTKPKQNNTPDCVLWEEGRKITPEREKCLFSLGCVSVLCMDSALSSALWLCFHTCQCVEAFILVKSNLIILSFVISAFYDLGNLSLTWSHGGFSPYVIFLSWCFSL